MEEILLIEYKNKKDISDLLYSENKIVLKDVSNDKKLLEWLTLTLLTIYVIKPFTDAFFKEAGKDFYSFLKGVLKEVFKTKDKSTVTILVINITNVKISFHLPMEDKLVDEMTEAIKISHESKFLEKLIKEKKLSMGDTLDLEYDPLENIWFEKKN